MSSPCRYDLWPFEAFTRRALPLLETLGAATSPSLFSEEEETVYPMTLAEADYRAFCSVALPKLASVFPIDDTQVDLSAYQPQEPDFSFHIQPRERCGSTAV